LKRRFKNEAIGLSKRPFMLQCIIIQALLFSSITEEETNCENDQSYYHQEHPVPRAF